MFSRNSVSIWSILKKCIGLVRTCTFPVHTEPEPQNQDSLESGTEGKGPRTVEHQLWSQNKRNLNSGNYEHLLSASEKKRWRDPLWTVRSNVWESDRSWMFYVVHPPLSHYVPWCFGWACPSPSIGWCRNTRLHPQTCSWCQRSWVRLRARHMNLVLHVCDLSSQGDLLRPLIKDHVSANLSYHLF